MVLRILVLIMVCTLHLRFAESDEVNNISLPNHKVNNTFNKSAFIKNIIRKIGSLRQRYKDPVNQQEELEKIKHLLQTAADFKGSRSNNKYVDLIMQGINAVSRQKGGENNNAGSEKTNDVLRAGGKTKLQLVKAVEDKISQLAKGVLRKTGSKVEISMVLGKIKDEVIESAIKHRESADEIKSYAGFITDAVQKAIDNSKGRFQHTKNSIKEVQIGNETTIDTDQKSLPENYINRIQRKSYGNQNVNYFINYKHGVRQRYSPHCDCDCLAKNTCPKVQLLNELYCPYEKTKIALNKLCNGIIDCPDGSDETRCVEQALDIVKNTNNVIKGLQDFSQQNCFSTKVDNNTYDVYLKSLKKVFKSQSNFVNKLMENTNIDNLNRKQTINDVAVFVSSAYVSLEDVFCTSPVQSKTVQKENYNNQNNNNHSNNIPINNNNNFTNLITNSKMDEIDTLNSEKICACDRSNCKDSNCSLSCAKYCHKLYNLGRLECKIDDKDRSISVDLLCDGKSDCKDHLDEEGCTSGKGTGRYQAREFYTRILNTILTKTGTKHFSAVRNSFLTIYSIIENLAKIGTGPTIDVENFKVLRDRCFSMLTSTYSELIEKTSNADEIGEVYSFLVFLNKKLIVAFKLSHAGNKRVIDSDDCFCRDGNCAMHRCSNKCLRACSVQLKFTQYSCKPSTNSKQIFISAKDVCNGKPNCPAGDDELGCKNDICQTYHVMQLRKTIEGVGEKYKGSALGEALISWRKDVITVLNITENNHRPKVGVLKGLIQNILHDLVMSYASLENLKSDKVFTEYSRVAQRIMDALKSCQM